MKKLPLKQKLKNGWKNLKTFFYLVFEPIFGLDKRSLAVFRIGLGTLTILDILVRFQDLTAHYSDSGLLPRDVLIDRFFNNWYFSFHLATGNEYLIAALFILNIIFAVFLILGYRTKLMTFICWLFLISLHNRIPVVLNGGDVLFRLLYFWAIFLPLGATFSIDSALSKTKNKLKSVLSVATFGLMLQLASLYIYSALKKTDPIWVTEGSAVYYALSLDQFKTPIGEFLYQFPNIMTWLSHSVLLVEFFGPILILVPFNNKIWKTIGVFIFICLHLGFTLTMELGLFPYVAIVGWLAFLPDSFWGWFAKRNKNDISKVTVYFDGGCGFCSRMLELIYGLFRLNPETKPSFENKEALELMNKHNSWVVDFDGRKLFKFKALVELMSYSTLFKIPSYFLKIKPISWIGDRFYEFVASHRDMLYPAIRWYKAPDKIRLNNGFWVGLFLWIVIGYTTMWNLRTLDFDFYDDYFPTNVNPFAYVLRIDQNWDMFSPYPLVIDGWFVIEGERSDGSIVNVFHPDQPVTYDKPESVVDYYPSQRWRKYLMNLRRDNYSSYRGYFADYLCWKGVNDAIEENLTLKSIKITFVEERTLKNYQTGEPNPVELYSQGC